MIQLAGCAWQIVRSQDLQVARSKKEVNAFPDLAFQQNPRRTFRWPEWPLKNWLDYKTALQIQQYASSVGVGYTATEQAESRRRSRSAYEALNDSVQRTLSQCQL
jgi:hypothetical protein